MKPNVIQFLKQHRVRFYEAGTRNTSEGWVSIKCPFCGDRSNHLGINIAEGNYTCWRCNAKGSFIKLVMTLNSCGYEEAKKLLHLYRDPSAKNPSPERRENELQVEKNWELIKNGKEHPVLLPFLKLRRFGLETVIREGCWVTQEGKYKHRLIMPIHYNGKLVAVQARDMTYKAQIPYLSSPNLLKQVYWIDCWAGGELVITEGIFDSWRVGRGKSIALFSVNYTKEQIRKILKLHPKEVMIAFDQDAKRKAIKLKAELEPYFPVRILNIRDDPANMTHSQLQNLIQRGEVNVKPESDTDSVTGSPSYSSENNQSRSYKILHPT
jgi:DNA primase